MKSCYKSTYFHALHLHALPSCCWLAHFRLMPQCKLSALQENIKKKNILRPRKSLNRKISFSHFLALQRVVCELRVWGHFGPKSHTRKIGNVHKDFEQYQLLIHNVLCQNVPIFLLYLLITRSVDTFWFEGINILWSGDIGIVWHRKSQTKNQQYSQFFFKLYQLFMNNFLCQTVSKPKLLST